MTTDERYFAGAMLQAGEQEPLETELEWEPWDGEEHWPSCVVQTIGKLFMSLGICQGYRVELSHYEHGQPRARMYLGYSHVGANTHSA